MKLRSLVIVLTVALAPLAGHAQVGLFLNPIAMRVSNSTADHGLFAFLGDGKTSQMFYGPEFGAYYDFKTPYTFHAGVEMRDSIVHGNSASLNSFEVGLRLSGKPFTHPWKPYVEPFIGAGTSEAPLTAIHVTKAKYGVYAGLDYETHHHIDFRAIEIGYSSLKTASSVTIGGGGTSNTFPSSTILSISTGLVFRFP
jgi:hypothetical protein